MEIIYHKKLNSTHKYLLENIKSRKINTPTMIIANEQTDGIGTHNREWKSLKGNLFISFCDEIENLPEDLPLQSISIYFAYLMKEVLNSFGSKVWIKWPNDFYFEDKKVGGVLSQIVSNKYICSIGLNLVKAPQNFSSKYQIEFTKSKKFYATVEGKKIPLKDAILESDGSIKINNKKVYSLR